MADPIPRRAEATKATLSDDVFDDPDWIFERKLDGIRCLAFRDGGAVAARVAQPAVAQRALPGGRRGARARRRPGASSSTARSSGSSGGRTSFEALQRRGHDRGVKIAFYVFDVLWLDGERPARAPAARAQGGCCARRCASATASCAGRPTAAPTRASGCCAEACRNGWEGLIAKRADSPYAGKRSRDWLKFKCSAEQELVIGGYTAPRGSRERLRRAARRLLRRRRAALRRQGRHRLRRARRCATLGERMASARAAPTRPSAPATRPARDTTWVEPELVAQVGFTEWTRDGRLRHPRYLGPARRQARARGRARAPLVSGRPTKTR